MMTTTEAEITTEPGPLTDREGREWTWDSALHSWLHEQRNGDGASTLLLRDRAELDLPDPVLTEEVAVAERQGWFESSCGEAGGAHRLGDTQPLDMQPELAACDVCGDRGSAPCHCRPPGWTLPEDVVPDPVHGREQVPGGAT